MFRKIAIALLAAACFVPMLMSANSSPQERRQSARSAMDAGNFKDAYEAFAPLAMDPTDDPSEVSDDLRRAITCLQRLGRSSEIDDMRDKVIAAHARNWKLLWTAARTYYEGEGYGFIIAGTFNRGNRRANDGKYVLSIERDRVRALQLMQQAAALAPKDADRADLANFWYAFAEILLNNRQGDGAWRLQYLTDLSTLPDYDESNRYYRGRYYGQPRGAPVNEDGTPVYHSVPKSFEAATTDGQRWRWCLQQASELSPDEALRAKWMFAEFLRGQFDVQTMAYGGYGRFFGRAADDDTRKDESGAFAVGALKETETIARLANGIKRFALPDEFNFIKLLQEVADARKSTWGENAFNLLAQIFEDRQQYPRAAGFWRKSIDAYGPGSNNWKRNRLDQIVGNWARWDTLPTKPAGAEPSAYLVFRNGQQISFEAYELDVKRLLEDVKKYIRSRPNQLQWEQVDLQNIGWRIVQKDQKQYVGQRAAAWQMNVEPRAAHLDKRIQVNVPVKQSGAYLLRAAIAGGNTTQVVLWVADTSIVKKVLDGGMFCFVGDAVSGKPIANATVDFFGYEQRWIKDRTYEINIKEFSDTADGDGIVKTALAQQPQNYQWILTATTNDGRFAYHGFTGVWGARYYDYAYNQRKMFVMTDRPVYRPGQVVKFKAWLSQAQYDREGDSPFARRAFNVEFHNPKGEKYLQKNFATDAYGGFDGEIEIPKDATLGVYSIGIPSIGGGNYRVEEYKKPEFEVKIEAPSEPVMLGEKITAKINAKYYFGAPVTQARVKYKVLRSSYSANWYPVGRWDWFFGPGYWWFACDYTWYPGWIEWGCRRPIPWWFPARYEQPEVVSESEVPIAPDGTVSVEIDTALAKAVHADTDHRYEISAEVTDMSRRTIVGQGAVLVARKPFKVYAWVNRGYYYAGDVVEAEFCARTLDSKPVKGTGELKLLKITYENRKPVETVVGRWDLETNEEGRGRMQIKAAQAGQYRLSYTVTDAKQHTIEGGYVFVVRGQGFDGRDFRFNDIELTTDKREYAPGESVRLQVTANRADAAVVLFLRPSNGIYLPPRVIHLSGKSTIEDVAVVKKDMPNFFIEAFTIADGKVFDEMREVVVPPESRVTNIAVTPSASQYKPGQKARVRFKLTDDKGLPVIGSTVISIYDKSVEYISGGSNVPEIKSFFWKWRRSHHPRTESSLDRVGGHIVRGGEHYMQNLGVFGGMVADMQLGTDLNLAQQADSGGVGGRGFGGGMLAARAPAAARDGAMANREAEGVNGVDRRKSADGGDAPEPSLIEPTVRKNFADTALWAANLTTNSDGIAEVELTMPENLTGWKARVWSMSSGTRVGEGTAEFTTSKDLLVRLQAPRFFMQKDEVVISANIHNYLKTSKSVKAVLELPGGVLAPAPAVGRALLSVDTGPLVQLVDVLPNGEKRVDWRVKVLSPGQAVVRVSALSDEESDAMEMRFPSYIHGMFRTDSFSGAMRPADRTASLAFTVPAERLIEQSRLEVRYSPSVACAMVDALPYLVDYPYGCTEQTLNRFLPTVITQRVLLNMKLDLKDIQNKRTNLNAQEIGDDATRAADWKRTNPPNPGKPPRNPVFDMEEVKTMAREGLASLAAQQLSDGGWGWFSGWGERSWPHTTAVVVHGLQIAKSLEVQIPQGVLENGVAWLNRHQAEQITRLKNFATKTQPWKQYADNMDALAFMVLTDSGISDKDMLEFLYRDRNELSVYGKAVYGLALHKLAENQKLDMILQNISQYVVQDDENRTAYLRLPAGNVWWCWYGSETEAMGFYLKLLSRTQPGGAIAPKLAKYMITNRKHATYWNSTRDTAICIEALAEYIRASGEDNPDMIVQIAIDGIRAREVKIDASNLFSFDNKLVLTGANVPSGTHRIEFTKSGSGPLYFNAYLTNFTLEDPIRKAGLEVKVDRKYYKLIPVHRKIEVSGQRGQALDQKVEKYERQELADGTVLRSGDLVEIELEIDSKNDYEYIMFEDMKAAGFEPMEVRSGYNGNDLGAYMELRDDRVCFFARVLARGKHSVAYRMRAEIPGLFSALPTRVSAMYAPELKANSDEMKIGVSD